MKKNIFKCVMDAQATFFPSLAMAPDSGLLHVWLHIFLPTFLFNHYF